MSRVDLRIRSLVVHGGGSFAGEAFGAALGREIEARLGPAAGRGDLSARFTAEARRLGSTGRNATSRRPLRGHGRRARGQEARSTRSAAIMTQTVSRPLEKFRMPRTPGS